MEEFFGIPMDGIALGAGAATAAVFLFLGWLYLRNPVMFRYGLRNIPRRRVQTTLIVFGLMLATVIMTAALGTGDTVAHSIRSDALRLAGETDILIDWDTDNYPVPQDARRIPKSLVDELRQRFAGDPDIEGFLGVIQEQFAVVNPRTRLNEPNAWAMALPTAEAGPFGGLRDLDGNVVQLSGNEIVINEDLADALDAQPGDTLLLLYQGAPVEVRVKAIGPTSWMTGITQPNASGTPGFAADYDFLARLLGWEGSVGAIAVTAPGGVEGGLKHSSAAKAKLEAALAGQPYTVIALKQELIDLANTVGSFFTTFFMIFGAFSIAAGVLLIFLIFIMLAAERKPEMGMARAVGARRRHLVEAFLAEGMGYDLASALVGTLLGIGVTVAMVSIINRFAESGFGIVLDISITPRSLVIAFCVGLLATFAVISGAATRAARLNITAAIRDLPETRAVNPEAATLFGLLRGVLNALVAGGFLVLGAVGAARLPALLPWAALAIPSGLVGPFLFVLRGTNFAHPRAERLEGERIPLWPIWWVVTAPLYALALLVVWLVRERRPSRIPAWLLVLGIVIPPLGIVLAAMQDPRRPIPWAVGFATVGLFLAGLLFQWGLDENLAFPFGAAFSLAGLWVAATLRYFRYHERSVFTAVSVVLLGFWLTWPTGIYDRVTGELNGDIEMFFLSGIVLVTAGTFLVVYNADVVIPALAGMAARFRALLPAVKMAVTYPLTTRMRTGLTVAMIGLIMFSLIVMATLTRNFERIFLSDDARGGWDVLVTVNPNNPIADLQSALREAGFDTSVVAAVGSIRRADISEAQVRRPEDTDLSRYWFLGVDEEFLATTELEVKTLARGYTSSRGVWDAMAADPTLAVVDQTALTGGDGGFGLPEDILRLGVQLANGFEPFPLVLHDPGTGRETTVTVIGVVDDSAAIFFGGIILRQETLVQAFPDARYQQFVLRLVPGADSRRTAKAIEAALVQASAESLEKLLDDQRAAQAGFLLLFEGFLGLGLVVGIAALGVIAFRAVVERRQQIGMLRAIGFRRRLVSLTFLFESAFVAMSGIILGLILGVLFSWVIFTNGGTGDEETIGAGFTVPWLQLALICAVAFGASMLMTVIPARGAAGVAPAEALRFE